MKVGRSWKAGVGMGIAAALLAACSGGALGGDSTAADGTPGVTDTTIKLGAWEPKSGNFTVFSEINAGAKAYFHMLNEQGGIDGRKIEYVTRDDQYDPSKTVTVARRLVEDDKVFAIVASTGSPTNAAVLDYMERAEVPNIAPIAGGDIFLDKFRKNWFPMIPPYSRGAALVTEYAVDDLGLERVAVLYENDEVGQPALEPARTALKERGLEPVAEIGFPAGEVDFSAYAKKLKDSGADAVVAWAGTSAVAGAQKAAAAISYEPTWLAHVSAATPTFFELGGQDGTYFPNYMTPLPSPIEEAKQFEEAMAAVAPNVDPGTLSEQGWISASIFTDGARRALEDGELTRESLIDALESLESESYSTELASGIGYSPESHPGITKQVIVQAKDGSLVTVTEPRA